MASSESIGDRIERRVRDWSQWSRAERRGMDRIVQEVLDHCRNGTGNAFIASWCERNLVGVENREKGK